MATSATLANVNLATLAGGLGRVRGGGLPGVFEALSSSLLLSSLELSDTQVYEP